MESVNPAVIHLALKSTEGRIERGKVQLDTREKTSRQHLIIDDLNEPLCIKHMKFKKSDIETDRAVNKEIRSEKE
jgi:hypothetical protein